MLISSIILIVLLLVSPALAEPTITVHNSEELQGAMTRVTPGTEILLTPGEYAGGLYFGNVKGEPGRPIRIAAADAKRPPVISGGMTGLQLSDVAYVELHNLTFTGSQTNGLNIDDGGSYDTPSHHVLLRNLRVTDIGSDGNHDGIKLSGVDDFRVEGCVIERWGSGGQGIDMVGCHNGVIEACQLRFADEKGAGIQAKGGSRHIDIRRCRFEHAGARAVNIGGSTGLQFFRPPLQPNQPHAEAGEILVEGCTFIGSSAPIAFVGVDGAVVRFNTIYRPMRWVLRILQETRAEGFVPCRQGVFTDNIVAFRSDEVATTVNIGPATSPETFTFARNWWYCLDEPTESTPTLPTPETDSAVGKDPRFQNAEAGELSLQQESPARQAGADALNHARAR